jgi:hypothetical protein
MVEEERGREREKDLGLFEACIEGYCSDVRVSHKEYEFLPSDW